ncbi:TRAP transporter large permease [Enemella sp. A6]|uniref:TRAP transporter large permease n=1 Tax=Enemella sp. A6 TaxID=3440152 RepID=UPI003EB6AFA6
MEPSTIAIIGILVMLVLLSLRMPIAFVMLAVGLTGSTVMIGSDAALQLVASDMYRQSASYAMTVVPLFILMGQVIFRTGMSARLFDAAYRWIGHLPGGVAATTIMASIAFSAVSGSNSAATATMGAVALPEMKKYNYDRRLAGGAIAIGGTLGVLIPPSTALIIIAIQAELSISVLFGAAIVPGLIVGLLLVITALVISWRKPELGPPGPKSTWGERIRSLTGVIEILVLFTVAIGGMLRGLFTPTEAAAVGAFGAIALALLRRKLTFSAFWKACVETLRISAMVILLVISAVVFGRFLSLTRAPFALADWVGNLAVPPLLVLLVVFVIYLIGGAIMDALGFLVISIPIFFPLVVALGYDVVWFTIIVTLITTLGAVTPPVGVNGFITSGLDKSWLNVVTVFRGVVPFYIPYAISCVLFMVFPQIILFAVGT